jgi:hypothetical protein
MPWSDIPGCRPFVYAGAFLPNARLFIEALFRAMCELRAGTGWDPSIHLFFLGTGKYRGKQIADYAADFGLDDIVHENRERFPFLTILNFLSAASTVLVIGSTEKHYTASKIFQALLSKRPVFSVFHHESSAVKIQEEAGADRFLVRYRPEMSSEELKEAFMESLRDIVMHSDSWCPNLGALDPYSAKESARNLVDTIETCAGAGVGS